MRWKYKTIKLAAEGWFTGGKLDETKLDYMMNELGEEEWELVSAFDTNEAYGNTKDAVLIFKKPKH